MDEVALDALEPILATCGCFLICGYAVSQVTNVLMQGGRDALGSREGVIPACLAWDVKYWYRSRLPVQIKEDRAQLSVSTHLGIGVTLVSCRK